MAFAKYIEKEKKGSFMKNTEMLASVVRIDEVKCNNCYACITACPVKLCMDGSGEKLQINANLCIGCGNCIDICSHKARYIIDDSSRFFEDIKKESRLSPLSLRRSPHFSRKSTLTLTVTSSRWVSRRYLT